jgi:hypothetical protein
MTEVRSIAIVGGGLYDPVTGCNQPPVVPAIE